jgi:erythronate-4-phosphate dehydrogenase
VDENLLGARAFFEDLGTLVTRPGRAVTTADVAAADVLLLRSQTRVDAALLGDARPRFVGTATAGTDHVDTALLAARGIPFASAPGCNADPVADWVVTAVAHAVLEGRLVPGRSRCAVVGGGAVGSRVVRRLVALGFETGLSDPPLETARHRPGVPWLSWAEVLEADLVTLHVPLTRDGPHATRRLLDAAALERLRPGTVLLQAARGGVVDDAALDARLRRADDLWVALDVWDGEPDRVPGLAGRVRFATPHIAGHSLDGKARGTEMIHDALCARLGRPPRVRAADVLPPPPPPRAVAGTSAEAGWRAVTQGYDLAADTRALRETEALDGPARAAAFDELRRAYPPRRDFSVQRVRARGEAAAVCSGAGFVVEEATA